MIEWRTAIVIVEAVMETLWQDLRYGARMLAKNRGYTATVVLTLALGIGACTAIFSVVYGVLLRPLPYPEPERIARVWEVDAKGQPMNLADPNFTDVYQQNHSFQWLAEYSGVSAISVSNGTEAARANEADVSSDFFRVIGIQPALGRTFSAEELRQGGPAVAIVNYGYWQRHLGGDSDLSRYHLNFDGHAHSVIGVMPRGFDFPTDAELLIPREQERTVPSRTAHNWRVIGRLKDGATPEQAQADLTVIARRLKAQYGDETWMVDARVMPLRAASVSQVRSALLTLLGAVGFLLLVACANAANLLLARLAARQKELAVRLALGAGRARLARQLLTEALVVSLLAAGAGILLAQWGLGLFLAAQPGNLPRAAEISLNAPVLGFAMAMALLVAAGLGLTAAFTSAGKDPQEALKAGWRTGAQSSGPRGLRGALVAAQMAVTLVLLVGAGLLGRSFLRLLAVDPGFRTGDVVAMDVSWPAAEGAAALAQRVQLLDDVTARMRGVSGVENVGGISSFPLSASGSNGEFLIAGPQEHLANLEEFQRIASDPARTSYAEYRAASDDYFRAMAIPLERGRLFTATDTGDSPHVALISASLAQSRWPGQNPLGQQIEFGNMDGDLRLLTIVGVVADVHDGGVDAKVAPTVYVNYRQRPRLDDFTIVLHTAGNSAGAISSARAILHDLVPDVPPRFRTVEQVFAASLANRRFSLMLLGVFAATALLLAMMGTYGVVSYFVSQRTRDIGVRMALGAQAGDILRLILGQGLRMALIGIAAGVVGALALTRLMASFLFGVTASDPVTFGGVALLLAAVAAAACFVPARRATRLDPMVALRYQ